MEEVLKIGTWMLLASVKYLFAVPVILTQSNWPWYIDALIASIGGSIGVRRKAERILGKLQNTQGGSNGNARYVQTVRFTRSPCAFHGIASASRA